MNHKAPWGMVFSVAAMIVACAILGYTLAKPSEARELLAALGSNPISRAIGPAPLLVEWRFGDRSVSYGRVRNVSWQPIEMGRVTYRPPALVSERGFVTGIGRAPEVQSYWNYTETPGRVLQPDETRGFMVAAPVNPNQSGIEIRDAAGNLLRYTERVLP